MSSKKGMQSPKFGNAMKKFQSNLFSDKISENFKK